MTTKALQRSVRRTTRKSIRSTVGTENHIDIGTRLRHARLTKEFSLRQLADEVRCTEGFLSKIEHNKSRPSLAMLHRLVTALEINIAELFSEASSVIGPVAIMRNGERSTIQTESMRRGRGIVLERLVSNSIAALIEANIHHIAPKGSSDGFIQHEGEEIGYVLEGTLELIVDHTTYIVQEGDTFFFKSSLAHGYKNPGRVETKVLWVNTPPSF